MHDDLSINWQLTSFEELAPGQLYAILQLRQDVFVLEQTCLYPDMDGKDQGALHLSGWEGETLLAYLRCIAPMGSDDPSRLGRIVTSPAARGKGLGAPLVRRGIEANLEHWPNHPIEIGAQAHLEKFYSSVGFRTISEPYDEDGIPHIDMILEK